MTKFSDLQMMKALKASHGLISSAAVALGVSRSALHKRINARADLKELLEEIRESILDEAEAVIFDKVKEGSDKNARFVLQHLGGSRGYKSGVQNFNAGSVIFTIIDGPDEPPTNDSD